MQEVKLVWKNVSLFRKVCLIGPPRITARVPLNNYKTLGEMRHIASRARCRDVYMHAERKLIFSLFLFIYIYK